MEAIDVCAFKAYAVCCRGKIDSDSSISCALSNLNFLENWLALFGIFPKRHTGCCAYIGVRVLHAQHIVICLTWDCLNDDLSTLKCTRFACQNQMAKINFCQNKKVYSQAFSLYHEGVDQFLPFWFSINSSQILQKANIDKKVMSMLHF